MRFLNHHHQPMPTRFLLIILLISLGGCATYTGSELAQFHHLGVPAPLLAKLEHHRPLLPEDLVTLRRLHAPDPWVIRHLNDVGVDYVVTRSDVTKLRKADVHPAVIDAFLRASDRFAVRRYARPYYDPWYDYDPWLWPGGYGGWSFGYYSGFGHGGHHHHH
jgi:hypothetical protein